MPAKKVLFICNHNAARSQMAEGYVRAVYGSRYRVWSAGIRASSASRYAIAMMQEIGIDIASQQSKSLEALYGIEMDLVIVLCENSPGVYPLFPWTKECIYARFSDPGGFTGNEEEIRHQFRLLREKITAWIDTCLG